LLEGSSKIGKIPEDRWSEARFQGAAEPEPGFSYTQAAGVLSDPFAFDADYFRISRREAEQMDPQQRLLLETTARAFDHAGIDPNTLEATKTGVFVGAAAADHSTRISQSPDLIGPHFMLGNTLSILSNRLSYTWDFRGPSMTVDTACSSSLVALDLARAALERGEIDTAIVAGVNMLLSPYSFIGFSQARMVSPNGKCTPFTADADGYVRSEGAVVFVLQNRSKAELSKLNVRSILVGTAVNSDGKTNGLALPSSERQAELMQSVVEACDIAPEELAFVEAHGTGTPIGDPREAAAISDAYATRRDKPLPLGSIKAHFGHLEPAAGLVGLLKAQLCLERGYLPAMPGADNPSPDIDFEALNLDLPSEGQSLPPRDGGWSAAINSFGFGGTNAHAVLRQAPRGKPSASTVPPSLLLTAASPTALSNLVEGWAEVAETAETDTLAAMAVSANRRIARHAYRQCFKAGSREILQDALQNWLDDDSTPQRSIGQDLLVAFVFSGNGSAWAGMGRDVFAGDKAFKARFKEAAKVFASLGCPDLEALLFDPDLESQLDRADVVQPLIFSIQVSLASALIAAGVQPRATLGHSVGECAAAVVAGRVTLSEAARIIVSRSKAFEPLLGTGEMAALNCDIDTAKAMIADLGLPLDVSAENSPRNVTVSGPKEAIARLLKRAKTNRISALRLGVAYPYHSRAVDQITKALIEDLGDVAHGPSDTHFYSGCLGTRADDVPLDTAYWRRNARDMVAFKSAVEAMDADGLGLFLEISPRSVLLGNLRDSLATSGRPHALLDTLKKDTRADTMPETIARKVLAAGGETDELKILGPKKAQVVSVPDYPFDREVLKLPPSSGFAAEVNAGPEHPLLGRKLSTDVYAWTSSVSLARLPWLADHKVNGSVLLPAMGMLDMFRAAAADVAKGDTFELRDIEFLKPVVLDQGTARLHLTFDDRTQRLTMRLEKDGGSERAAQATLRVGVPELTLQCSVSANQTADQLYDELANAGLQYGEAFARLARIGARTNCLDIGLADTKDGSAAESFACRMDALLHGAALMVKAQGMRVPYRIARARFQDGGEILGGRLLPAENGLQGGLNVSATDGAGQVRVQLDGLAFARLPAAARPKHLVHDESRLRLSKSAPVAKAVLEQMTETCNREPSDLDVARGAVAGRLAWNICFETGEANDPRADLAADWLIDREIAQDSKNGLVAHDACPWPSLDDLLLLLSERLSFASDELAATLLGASIGSTPKRQPLSRVRGFAAEFLEHLAGEPLRLLLAGDIDKRLIAKARALGHHVTLTAPDLDVCLARLGDADDLDFAARSVDRLANSEPFDLVIALSTLALDDTNADALASCAKRATEVVLIDERPDIFALLTHGYESRARAFATLRRFGSPTSFDAPGDSAVMIHHRVNTEADSDVTNWPARIVGTGKLAERLAKLAPNAAQATRLVILPDTAAPEERFTLMRDTAAGLKETETAWIIALDHSHVGELSGLRRVLCNETGRDLRLAIVAEQTEPETLLATLQDTAETELLLSNTGLETLRILPEAMEPVSPPQARQRLVPAIDLGHRAAPEWVVEPRDPPGNGEVEIAVEATGLNFRDVMLARGILPDDAFLGGYAGRNLGIECAGVVTRSGPETTLKVGDRVATFAAGAFASHTTVPEACVLPLPDDVSLTEAATLPVAFLTADYALRDCARLTKGESVLIHGGAGGVGIAAIQIARAMGLRVFATAGTPEKRRLLKAMEIEACFDSRSLDFADQVMQATGGRGVDAVVNSLAGVFQAASLECLAPFGRFVELGKRDIFENGSLGLRAMKNNISFFAVDADQLVKERPDRAIAVLDRVANALDTGDVLPLPHRVLTHEAVSDAIETMQRADHIGKIVVTAPKVEESAPRPNVDYRGAWLITGGTRGFGLATAHWLAHRGARSLWLISRSGTLDDADRSALEALGVEVNVVALDVTSEADMQTLADQISEREGKLAGVVHAAMVLDDAPATDLNTDRFRRVWDPKVEGARLLDQLTRALNPVHFWLYSSIATRFGNPAQSAYVAANGALEDLARARAAEGLPVLAVAWSAIGDAGYLQTSEELRERIAANGVVPLSAQSALNTLDKAVRGARDSATLAIGSVDWSKLAHTLQIKSDPLFENLRLREAAVDGTDLDTLIAEQGVEVAAKTVTALLLKEFAQILRVPEAKLDATLSLGEIGFDSLLSMHLRMTIEERLNTQLPANVLSERLTIQRLAMILVEARAAPAELDRSLAKALAERHLVDTDVANETREEIVRAAIGRGRT